MKVFLVDDHSLVREGIKHVITRHFADAVVYEASNFSEASTIAEQQQEFDIVLLDFLLPDIDGTECIEKLRLLLPTSPILSLSSVDDSKIIGKAMNSGIQGFIHKSSKADIMTSAINLILSGGIYFPPELFRGKQVTGTDSSFKNPAKSFELTSRQRDVLKGLVDGKSNKEIAVTLNLSEATVKTHLVGLFRLLDVSNRTQAVTIALEFGLLNNT